MVKVWKFDPKQLPGDVESAEPEELQGFSNAIVDGIADAIDEVRRRKRRPFVLFIQGITITMAFIGVWSMLILMLGHFERGDVLVYVPVIGLMAPAMILVWLFSVIVAKLAGRL
jgi:hypothetical protein